MSKAKEKAVSNLPLLQKRIIETAERKFPEISKEHCPERGEGVCEITGRACELRNCPKIQKARSAGD